MIGNTQMFYIMLILPALFGMTLVGEGLYKITHYQPGWASIIFGTLFLIIVAFGYFYLKSYL